MVSITLSIDDNKYQNYKATILAVHPVPVDEPTGKPLHTEDEWVKIRLLNIAKKDYGKYIKKLAIKTAIIDNDIIS